MNTEISGIIAMFVITLLLAIPLGKYIAKVYGGERTLLDPVFNPLEKGFFKISGIDPNREMTWQKNLMALLAINLIWFLLGMFIFMNMGWLPLNPDHNPSQSADLAFNTNTEQKNLVESIKEDSGRLLKITSELLNMTQVESGTIQLNVIPSDVNEIVDYAINANKAAAEQKQIKFEINLPDNLAKVLADKEKTSWVLTNLLSNAIRYSYDNSIIHLNVNADGEKIKFDVTDTGQGISPQYVDKIFDRYFRIPGTKKEGTGLGLSISKEFIETQGGQISVKSDFGAGSTFSFTLNRM